jgi:hypothetical protein
MIERFQMKDDLLPGEVVLFFDKVDGDLVRRSLGMETRQCCDGIIFYKKRERVVICLVEMKSDNLGEAEMQIKGTYDQWRDKNLEKEIEAS